MDYFYDVRNYLDITFSDEETDAKLTGICERAEGFLRKVAGSQITFSKDMEDQDLLQLLFDCIRYMWSGARDEFEKNYAEDLFMLRANYHADTMQEAEETGE